MKKSADGKTCVYLHLRKGKVFYVGIGSISRSKTTKSRPAKWYELCPDKRFSVKIHREGLSKEKAEEIEEKLVHELSEKGFNLANSYITKPGIVAIDLVRGDVGQQNKNASGRTLNVPWLMLDSFGSAGQPFRFQITVDGVTKRMFSETLPDLLNDACVHFDYAYQPKQFATKSRLRQLQDFLFALDYLVENGAAAFLEKYADPKRHVEALSQYVELPRYTVVNGVPKKEFASQFRQQFYHSGPPLKKYPPCEDWPNGPRKRFINFLNKVARIVDSK